MLTFKDTSSKIGIVPKLYLGFALVVLSMLVVIGFIYKQSIDDSNAITSNNHIYEVMTETDTLLTSLLNMETGMRGYSIAGIEDFLEPYNNGQRDFRTHLKAIKELTRDNPGQQVKISQLQQAELQWANSAREMIEQRRNIAAGQGSMIDLIESVQTMQNKRHMDGMRDNLNAIYGEELGLLQLRTITLQERARISRQVAIVGGLMAIFLASLFAFFIASDFRERRKVAEKFQQMNSELQDINAILEEEVMERQTTEEALSEANAHLETRVKERTNQLQEINATLEEEIMERQATEEALQDSRDALLVREQQLEYYSNEVAATNTELKSFVNTIAHDFRSPMVNLMGFSAELGQSLTDLKEIVHGSESFLPQEVQVKVNELLEKDVPEAQMFIKSSVNRLSRMVDALLNLSRLGRREMCYDEVDMNKLVNMIIQSYTHQITEKHIQVEIGTLPKIEIDYLVMEQIISNLIDNAIKYLDPSRPGKIEGSCTENENEYVVSVKDNGRGILNTDCEKMFDLFRRCGNQDQPGEGMGLAYVRTLIRKLGGKVWCESELGVGTKMSFTVPKILPSN